MMLLFILYAKVLHEILMKKNPTKQKPNAQEVGKPWHKPKDLALTRAPSWTGLACTLHHTPSLPLTRALHPDMQSHLLLLPRHLSLSCCVLRWNAPPLSLNVTPGSHPDTCGPSCAV